ncbi:hypothetical protein JL720_4055 [Aureococcus anophagefferens]|nr:hypothetical protein JL720_4055 [Aureococcus anophagefferens]
MGAAGGYAGAPLLALLCACALRCADAKTWSAAPTGLAFPNATGVWEDVAGLAVTVRGGAGARLLLSHTLSVYAAYDSPDASYVAEGSLQVRFVVDGAPLRAGATLLDANLHSEARVKAEAALGRAVVTLNDDRAKVVKVQWKAAGAATWRSDPSLKEGFSSGRVLTATAHEALHAAEPLSAAALSRSDWVAVKDTAATFDLPYATDVRLGYAVTLMATATQPTFANPFDNDDLVQARLTVDGQSYRETVAAASSRDRYASAAATLARGARAAEPGVHTVALEWRKGGSSGRLWRCDPGAADGFANSRTVYAAPVQERGADAISILQMVSTTALPEATTEDWATVETASFDVPAEGVVVVEYALPVTLHGRPDFDSWTFASLQTVEARVLLDGVPYREDGSMVGTSVARTFDELRGQLAAPLAPGSHTATLQWRANRPEAWQLVSGRYGGLEESLVTILLDFDQVPSLVGPAALTAREDAATRVAGLAIEGVTFLDAYGVLIELFADHGAAVFAATGESNATVSVRVANELLSDVEYRPDANYHGDDVLVVLLASTTETNATDLLRIPVAVAAVNDGAVLRTPSALSVAEGGRVSLGGVSFADVDSASDPNLEYKLTFLALGGAFLPCDGDDTAPFLEVAGTAADVNDCVAAMYYEPYEGFRGAYVENITVVAPPYYELALGGLVVDGSDAGELVTVALRTDAADALLSLGDGFERSGVSNVSYAEDAITLTGSPANLTAALANLGYVREPGDDAGALDILGFPRPRRGPATGGTRVLLDVAGAGAAPLSCQFGNATAPAELLYNDTYACDAPEASRAGYAALRVTDGGFWSDERQFLYEAPLVVSSLSPPVGPRSGGTTILVLLEEPGCVPSDALACVVGGTPTPATYVNATALSCVAPPSDVEGAAGVAVSTNGVDVSATTRSFEYTRPLADLVLRPAFGPVAGGTRVEVSSPGGGFDVGLPYLCRFGLDAAPAAVYDAATLVCYAPPVRRARGAAGAVGLKLSVGGRDPASSGRALTYVYEDDALLSALEPASGPAAGGTVVAVSGLNIPDSTDLRCRFGALDVDARWVSSTEAECVAPAAAAPGAVAVRLGVADQQMSADALEFVYAAALDLAAASPLSGPANGGTVVAIEGSGFRFSTLLHCRFGWTEVAATFVSETEIRCASPSGESGPATLSVSNNKQDYVDLASSFVYEVSPVVASIAPDVGAVAGGTAVTILGSGFEDVTLCLFGDEAIPATVASATEVRCAAPAAVAGAVAVGVSINGADAYAARPSTATWPCRRCCPWSRRRAASPAAGRSSCGGLNFADSSLLACRFGTATAPARWVNSTELECEAPAGAAGDVAVEVSVNGADFTDDGATFSYLATAVVSGVSPASGPSTGGTEVTVTGSDLAFSTTLACRFAFVDVAASFVSSSELRCVAPAHGAGSVSFAVVDDGRVLYGASDAFEYKPLMVVSGLSPPRGGTGGGTVVAVEGSGFLACASSVARVRRRAAASVEVVSATLLRCVAPAHAEGPSPCAWARPGTRPSARRATRPTAVAEPAAISAHPGSGARSGGEPITVYGSNFVDASELSCRFGGSALSDARWVSATELVCASPAGAGTVRVEVTVNGQDWGASSASFAYLAGDVAYAVTPASGPAAGGTEVTVGGADFQFTAELACRFSNDETYLVMAAAFVDASTIRCVAPTWAGRETVVLALSSNGVDFTDVGAFAFEAPATLDGIAPTMGSIAGGTAVELRGARRPRAPLAPPRVSGNGADFYASAVDFVYLDDLAATAVEPASASVAGGVEVTVTGDGFAYSESLSCRLGDAVVAARFVSPTELACVAPAHDAGAVVLALSGNGLDFVDVAEFAFWPEAVVLGARPAFGGVSGGTVVALAGANFPVDAGDVACLFGDVPAAAVGVVSASEVRCESPAAAAGTAKLSLSFNGAEARAGVDLTYRYVAGVLLGQLEPASGPAAGGTVVAVSGLNIPDSTDLRCRFGALDVDARWVSSTEADWTEVAATFVSETEIRCASPSGESGPATLSVSNNKQDYVDLASSFVYEVSPVVASIAPDVGAVAGGTAVTILGSGFEDVTLCLFGDEAIPATVASATEVRCAAPAAAAGAVAVGVSINGADAYAGTSQYRYVAVPEVLSLEPASGGVAGGGTVIVRGLNFADSSLLACRFGTATAPRGDGDGSDLAFSTTLACRFAFVDVAASFVSSSELRCVAPAHGAGSVSFAVVDDGRVLYGASDAFEYKPLMVVSGLSPPRGGTGGGTVVAVEGSGFLAYASSVTCAFGDAPAASVEVVSATLLRCVAPAHAEGSVAVRVGAAGDAAVGAASDATYGFVAEPAAISVHPGSGARSGGEPITVYGSNFLVCASPAGAGTVRVEVTVNGRDWGASSASFAYLAGDVTYAVTPASGPAAGGAELAIAASSPAAFDGADARCRFGVVDVAATRGGDGALACVAPALDAGAYALTVVVEDAPRASLTYEAFDASPRPAAVDASSKACAAPPHLAGDVVLSVAPCALGATAATTSSTATYVYHEPVEVFNVFPRVFSASTRGEILVVGAHFVDSPALACSVYGAAQAARFISSSRLACSPPPVKDRAYVASMAAGLANTGVGAVRASNNGFDYSASSSDVKVAPNVVLNYAVPSIVTASTATLDVFGSGFLDDFADSCAVPPGGRVANVTVCYETSGCAEFALDLAAADAGVSFTGAAPDVADVAGGAVVTLGVANLDADAAACVFSGFGGGDVVVDAAVGDAVTCAAPAAPAGFGSLALRVYGETGFDDAAAVDFAFAPRPTLVAATPAVLPESGGLVKVAGGDFDAGLPVYCDFSGSFEPASVLSATEIACLAPPRRGDADVVLRVGHAQSELSAAAVVLDYFHPATLFAASPAVGVLAGGTEVAITGTNLDAFDATNIAPLCRFGESTTAYAQVVSKNEIRCVSPGWGEPGPVDLWLSLNDGFHFSLLPGAFTYVDKVHVDSAALREDDTNTTVVVEGAGFLDAPYLSHCVIDDTVLVEITALTDDRVECDVDASVVAAAAVVALSAGALDAVSNKARVVARARAVVATRRWPSSAARAAAMVADAAVSAAHRTTVSSVERATTARGVESVRALGTNFDAAREMLCIFDGRAWRYATHVSENAVECPLPPAGTSSVSVLSEGVPRLENASLADAALAVGDAPVVAAYAPARGPAVGGATVALRGVFDLSRGLYCHFGGVGVAATIANTTTAACVSPPSAGESCLLTFSYDAAVAGSEGVAFAFFHDVEARSASPAAASAAGGATVTVAGANFPRDAALACAFGDVAVDAVWVSAAAVLCVAPPLEPGTVELRVVRLGDAAAGPSVPFVALPDPHANALLAPFAPAIAGGDVVAVAGVGFEHATAEAACRFGDRVVAAAADGAFRCVAPRLAATGHVRLALSNDGATFFGDVPLAFDAAERRGFADLVVASETTAEGSLVLTVDADPASDLACYDAVTGADADVAGDSCAFPASRLRDDVVICVVVDGVQSLLSSLTPSSLAFEESGAVVRISANASGDAFGLPVACDFGGLETRADVLDGDVYCATPAAPAGAPRTVDVTVLEHEAIAARFEGAEITFAAAPRVDAVVPRSAPVAGSAALTVLGDFPGEAPLYCRFGNASTPAARRNASALACAAPPGSRATSTSTSATARICRRPSARASHASRRRRKPGTVPLTLALDGARAATAATFAYDAVVVVVAVTPRIIPGGGGTPVVVTLEDDAAHGIACHFGDVVVAPTAVAGPEVTCPSPKRGAGAVEVAASLNGVDVSEGLTVDFTAPLEVHAAEPNRGPAAGGTVVALKGRGFEPSGGLACDFGVGAAAPAVFVSSSEIRCEAPPFPAAGVYRVRVKTADGVLDADGVDFEVGGAPIILDVDAVVGSPTGGAEVVVSARFAETPTTDAACRFGAESVPGAWLAPGKVLCVAPPQLRGASSLALSTNGGADYSEISADFSFDDAPEALSVAPSYGYRALLADPRDAPASAATYVSATKLRCAAPDTLRATTSRVEVTVNGVEYSTQDVFYTRLAPPFSARGGPARGSELGGAAVRVDGVSVSENTTTLDAACVFGTTVAEARVVDGDVYCIAPALAPGFSTDVTLRLNGLDDVDAALPWSYAAYAAPSVGAVEPSLGSTAGDTLITVTGVNLAALAPGASCVFDGDAYVPAEIVGRDAPVAAPATGPSTGGTLVTILGDFSTFSERPADASCAFGDRDVAAALVNASALACVAPAAAGKRRVALAVVDGGDGSRSSALAYDYEHPIAIYAMTEGLQDGALAATGANFLDGVGLSCRLAGRVFEAKWMSSTLVVCFFPPKSERPALDESTRAAVSNNGVDFVEFFGVVAAAGAAPEPPSFDAAEERQRSRRPRANGSRARSATTVDAFFSEGATDEAFCHTPALAGPVAFGFSVDGATIPVPAPFATFRFRPQAHASSLEPAAAAPGALVRVRASNVRGPGLLACRFGDHAPVSGTYVEEDVVDCAAPATGGAGEVADLEYVDPVEVYRADPSFGSDRGGTTVSLKGANFPNAVDLACVFGESSVPATFPFSYVLGEAVVAVSPTGGPTTGGGVVRVRGSGFTTTTLICFDGVSARTTFVSSSEVRAVAPPSTRAAVARVDACEDARRRRPPLASGHVFTYISSATATDAAPLSPCDGGTVVAITGTGFVDDGRTSCNFGGSTVDAVFLSATNLACVAPRWRRNEDVATFLEIASEKQPTLSRRFAFTYEAVVATDPGADGEFPVVYAATPAVILAEGGALVTVEGRNFARHSDALACRFGDLVAAATFQDDGTLTCAAPARIPSRVRLQVSNDGGGFWSPTYAEVTFASEPSVYALEPASGPLKGATAVRVFGSHFFGDVLCRFGDSLAPASVVSDVEVRCAAPPSDGRRPRKVAVAVSCDNETFSRSTATFAYDATPEVRSLSPAAGPGEGGTRVVLRGRGFKDRREARCRFGRDATVAAVFLSSERLLCVTPPHAAGEAMLEVSLNGVDFYGTFLKYAFAETPKIESLWPLMSMGQIGATAVSVFGSGFRNTLELACFFDNSRVPARFLSESAISGVAPARAPGLASVHVTVNGRDMASNTLNLLYVPEVLVTSVWPSRALATARAPVFVVGANFVNSTALKCAFGDVKVRGTYVSSSVVACVPPNVDALARGHRESGGAPQMDRRSLRTGDAAEDRDEYSSRVSLLPRYVEVRVSVNGLDYSDGAAAFEYYDELEKGYYETLGSAKPCPNGTLCRGAKPTNFTLCPPGTFQPRGGQVACLSCPVGYYCPDFGLSKPVLCPGGFVCSDLGEREPKTLCPPGHYCNPGTKSSDPFAFANNSEYERDAETGVTGTYAPGIHPPRPFDAARPMSSSRAVLAELPFPCPPGTYCALGASSPVSIPGNFSTPQRCFDGYFCPAGSGSPEGEGPCPTGHFCPTQMLAVACPLGHHCPGVGNTFPRECVPGTYNGLAGMSNCTLCPTGHICPGWTRVAPEICPAGFVCSSLGLSMPVLTCPEGYFCPKGTLTLDSSDPTAHRPVPCAPGTFCVGGVAHNLTIPWIPARPGGISAPQVCTEGTFCREASPSAVGSRSCYPGHYCPPGVSYPIQVPLGSFADDVGYVAPTTCFPGTYAPLSAALTCSVCPAGYSCSGYGTYEPKICVAGTYRSLADSVTCRLCPTGTYSTSNGSTDISLCLPCPEGRVCGEQGMFNLSVSDRCPEGHVCGTGTDRSTMFEHKCPAGTYCGLETLPVDQFVYACDAGYFCRTGTTKQMRNRDRCAVGYFCPPATADPGPPGDPHICDKRVASEFDPYEDQRYYAFLNYTIMDGSGEIDQIIGGDGVGEISVVASIMPVNVSAVSPNYTAPNWRNETVELFRTCPEYVKESGGEEIIVVGRNFYDSSLLMCRFTACRFTVDGNGRRDPRSCAVPDRWDRYYLCGNQIFNPTSISLVDFHTGYYSPDAETGTYPSLRDVADRSVVTPGRFISNTRVACEAPKFDFADAQIIANQFPQSCHMVDGELHYLQTCAEEDNARCYVKCEQSQTEDCDDEDGCETVVGECNDAVTAATPHGFRPIRDLVMRLTQNEMNDELAAHPNIRGPDPLYAGGASVNRWNPCYSAEVAVDNTHPERKEVPGSWAVMTYIINSKWVPDADTIAMDVGRCSHMDTSEEGDHTRDEGWYTLRGLETAMLSFDLQHLPSEMVYYEHYRLAIYEKYPCRQPLLLPEWFNSTTTPKNIVFNMTLFALDDVIFKIEFHIMHGGWLAAAAFFRNTATVQIVTPRRAKFVNEYSQNLLREEERSRNRESKKTDLITGKVPVRAAIGADMMRRKLSPYVSFEERDTEKFYIIGVVYNDNPDKRDAARPLNMPPRYKEYERGRVLVSFNTTYEAKAAVPTVVQNDRDLIVDSTWFDPFQGDYDMYDVCDELAGECDPPDGYPVDTSASAAHDVYFETFFRPEINPDTEDSLDFMQGFIEDKHVLLPYMPYFSNCREWDSYIPFSNLVESDQCALPPDTTRMAETPETKPTPTKRYSHPPLPHFDSIQAVKAPDLFVQFDMVPLADWCERTVECTYEERDTDTEDAPLWFNAPDGSTLFYFLKQPVDYLQYLGRETERLTERSIADLNNFGGSKIVFERGRNSDELIPVSVANGDGECADVIGYGCYPTRMILEIGYKQRVSDTWKEKNIIFAFLHFVEFNTAGVDPTVELPEYTLLLSYHPLDYIDLIIWFAFETKVFIGIFAFTGGMTVLVGFVLWVSVRLTTALENPPRLRIWSMLLLISGPPTQGVILGLFPITLAMLTMTVMVRQVIPAHVLFAFQPGFPLENRADSIYAEMMAGMAFNYLLYSGEGGESMDRGLMPIEWSDPVIIKEKLDAARKGRLGLSFIMMAIMCWYAGCRMFLPDRISQREIDMQKRRDPAAEKEDIWKPNMWKRSNLIFSSFMIGLLCCVVCEFSYWQYFGTYIWFVIIGLRPIGQFLGAIVDNQLQEALLSAPVMTAFDVTCGVVTLSCDDFVDFLGGYFIELGMGLVEQIYFDPGLADFLDWLFEFVGGLWSAFLGSLPKWVRGGSAKVEEKVEEEANFAKRELEGVVAEGGETVEPILDAYGGYSTGAMALLYNVFVLLILIAYRNEVQMTIIYNIKNLDMLYFLLFSLILIPFQFVADVFTLSVLELFHGWKIYDYLIYTRYRFLQRETKWKGLEDSLDECIDESVRTLDQMCFSSQYYMMLTIHVNGIMMFVFGIQMMLQANYNFFGDQMAPFIVGLGYFVCWAVEWGVIKLALLVKLWRVKHENTAWHTQMQEQDEFEIPGWEDLKGSSHDAFMMNQRITSETFRFKFLNYNRAWLINQLPSILTPRTLRRSRPYLINQFTRILNQLNQDISSDSEDDGAKFGPVALKASSRQIVRWWLAQARRRMRLREVVQPLISKARGTQCENCLSRRQLQVECVVPLEVLAAQFDAENPDQEFDQVAWKTFWIKNQRYRTICMNCIAKAKLEERKEAAAVAADGEFGDDDDDDDDGRPKWGPVFLSPASRAILIKWHRMASTKLFGKGGKRRAAARAELSDDEGDAPQFKSLKPLDIDAASRAIAVKWLRTARANLQNLGDDGATKRRRRRPKKGEKSKSRKSKK